MRSCGATFSLLLLLLSGAFGDVSAGDIAASIGGDTTAASNSSGDVTTTIIIRLHDILGNCNFSGGRGVIR